MHLGIIATTDAYPHELVGLSRAAAECGHRVSVFLTASAVKLCENPRVAELANIPEVNMCLCTHSIREAGITDDRIPDGVVCGSQYNNAVISRDADKVITL